MEQIISKIGALDKYKGYLSNSSDIVEFNESLKNLKTSLEAKKQEGRIFQLGIVGQMKTGKSSFLNEYLFGEEILPTAATPMTAALTLIKYSDENKAEIEFYDRDDWNNIEENNKKYEKEYNKALEEAKEETEKKGRVFNKERFKFEDADSILKGSYEIYKNFKENGLDKSSLGETKTIKISNKKNILEDLKEYVGSKGKYTPLVKMTTLYINDDRIKDYIIVDTPGTNDPIISRGQKTKEFLGKCDYIVFLSYSSQFLDNNDNAYIKEQLPSEGIRDILILASKFDNQLSQESVFEDADGDIKVAYEEEKRKLSRKLNRWSEEFKKDENPLDLSKSELEFQSTMLYRIYKNFDNLSGIEKEIFNRLEEDYNNSTFTKELLKDLSGMPAVEKKISNILVRKEEIMKNGIKNLFDGKKDSLSKILEKIRKGFEERKFELSDVGMKDIESKISNLQGKISDLSSEIKNSVRTERENFDKKLKDEISKISNTKDRYSSLQKQSRSYEEEVDVDKGWFTSWKFWPHTETKTVRRNETFINIQDSIEQIISFAQDASERIERTSERLISKHIIKKAMRNGIIDLFELEDRPKVVSVIDNYIQKISIPQIQFNVNKYRDIVLSKYGSSYSQERDINFIEGLHNKALLTIIEDTEKAFIDVKGKLNSVLEEIEVNIVDELKEGIERDLKSLKEQLENQKESIKMTELGIEEVDACLKMM
ncbi:dynamin family protein [Fusobacterium hwasookii]|uniref:dynamin family protein n=1 Tax=Fusobacterium hwasookii TaxID=1583098 RepID=UPI0028E2343D|nr:dynamin family protein [Fusobacterium hwasookii]